jgi:hypothetical protein
LGNGVKACSHLELRDDGPRYMEMQSR